MDWYTTSGVSLLDCPKAMAIDAIATNHNIAKIPKPQQFFRKFRTQLELGALADLFAKYGRNRPSRLGVFREQRKTQLCFIHTYKHIHTPIYVFILVVCTAQLSYLNTPTNFLFIPTLWFPFKENGSSIIQ